MSNALGLLHEEMNERIAALRKAIAKNPNSMFVNILNEVLRIQVCIQQLLLNSLLKKSMNITLVKSQTEEDWEGLFINGQLVAEGEKLRNGFDILSLINPEQLSALIIKMQYITKEDEEFVNSKTMLPKHIVDVEGTHA